MICSLCLVVQVQSAEIHTRVRKQMCVHLCVYVHVCVCGNCDEAKEWTYCPYCRPPLKRCTWLVGVCVCVCMEQLFSSTTWGGSGGRHRRTTAVALGLVGTVAWTMWEENQGQEEGRERKRRDSLGKEAFTSWDKMRWPNEERTHGSEKRRHQRKEYVPLCRSALKQEKPQRPAGDVDRGIIWPQGHCRETWD